jgi:CMP/dCMP kinase
VDSARQAIVVSIDGPSASGKSSVSRGVAAELGFTYCDSGALYRAVTWKALEHGVACDDQPAVMAMLAATEWKFFREERVMHFAIDGRDPGQAIRSAVVGDNVSAIAKMPRVREFVVERLRGMAACGDLVMEGRDIGTVVFPDACCKYYLDASAEERARRRHADYVRQNEGNAIEEVYQSLQRRDETDSRRKTAPLQIPEDALVIDSTSLGLQEVIAIIVGDVREKLGLS